MITTRQVRVISEAARRVLGLACFLNDCPRHGGLNDSIQFNAAALS